MHILTELTSQEASQPDLTNSGLLELAKEIKACIAAGEEAQTREKEAKAEATLRFIAAGKLLIQAHERAPNFKSFLQEHGISRSRAYELIKIAGGDVEKVRADSAERKRRQRVRTQNGVRDMAHVTDTASELHRTGETRTPSGVRSDTTTDKATARTTSEAKPTAPAQFDPVSEVKLSIDRWFPHMDDAGRREIASYAAAWSLDSIPHFLKRVA